MVVAYPPKEPAVHARVRGEPSDRDRAQLLPGFAEPDGCLSSEEFVVQARLITLITNAELAAA